MLDQIVDLESGTMVRRWYSCACSIRSRSQVKTAREYGMTKRHLLYLLHFLAA